MRSRLAAHVSPRARPPTSRREGLWTVARLTAPVDSSWTAPGGVSARRAALARALPTTCPPSPWTALRAAHSRLDNPRPPGEQPSRPSCGRGLPTLPTAPTTTRLWDFRRKARDGWCPTRGSRAAGQSATREGCRLRRHPSHHAVGPRPTRVSFGATKNAISVPRTTRPGRPHANGAFDGHSCTLHDPDRSAERRRYRPVQAGTSLSCP